MTNDRNFDARSGFVDVCPTVTFGGQTIAHQEHHGKAFHHLRLRLYRGTWRTLDLSWIEKDTTSACAGKIRLRVRRSFLTPSLLNLPFEEYNRRFTHTKCMQALSDMPVKSSDNCFSIKAYRKAWSHVIKTCLSTSLFAVYFLPL